MGRCAGAKETLRGSDMRKATKIIISLAVVLIAGLNIIVPAFAQDPFTSIAIGGLSGASGAGLFGSMASMSGINIAWSQSGSDSMDAMWNKLNPDNVYFSGQKHEASGIGEDLYDYIDVDIGDWLSAQSDFIVNFINENNVTDNSSGSTSSFVSYGSIPIDSTTNMSPVLITIAEGQSGTYNIAGITIRAEANGVYTKFYLTDLKGVTHGWLNELYMPREGPAAIRIYAIQNNVCLKCYNNQYHNYTQLTTTSADNQHLINNPSEVWSSGTVNSNVFNGWEKARVKIPHSISGLSSGWTIPDFTNAINDLWNNNQQGQIVIQDTDQPVPPPTPTPLPDTQLGQMPFDDWVDLWGQGIYEQLENQSDALDFIGANGTDAIEELETIDENIGELEGTAESIDTNIGIGNGLLGGIKSVAESAVEYLEGIAEHVEELVEEIVEGTETLIAGILNQIPQVFGVIFGPIKQASSIWHYVVEWIQSISAPMSWMLSMASGTSYSIILPIYASLAGAVVLAFYKRFGK